MSQDVDVRCARGVVAWEEGGELSYALGVCGLETAQEGGVYVCGVGGVAVAGGDDARVDAGAVAVPDFDDGVWDGVTGRDVDDLGVED